MEPPDPDVPARRQPRPLIARPLPTLDLAALVEPAALGGAAALALSSKGDAVLLGLLLAVGAGRIGAGVAALLGAVSVAVRFGGTDLGLIASAQAVLGPAGLIGSTAAAASSWCAGAAVVLAGSTVRRAPTAPARANRPRRALGAREGAWRALPGLVGTALRAVPFGAAAAAFAIGPGPGGALWARVVATIVATAATVVLSRVGRWQATLAAVAAGAAAIVLAVVGT